MSKKLEFENAQVKKARTRIIGHTHEICIELLFDNCVIYINPKRSWFADKGKDILGNAQSTMPFFDLFEVFDIDCEDGANIEDLTGKYCRLLVEDYSTVVSIYHIIKDKCVLVDDLK